MPGQRKRSPQVRKDNSFLRKEILLRSKVSGFGFVPQSH